jgi:transcription termination factor Rho
VNDTDLLEGRASDSGSDGEGAPRPLDVPAADAATRATRRRASRPAGETADAPIKPASGGLAGKLLPELQEIASGLGIAGIARLRKGQLISAIQEARGDSAPAAMTPATTAPARETPSASVADASAGQHDSSAHEAPDRAPASTRNDSEARREDRPERTSESGDQRRDDRSERTSGDGEQRGDREPRRRSTYEERQRAREERAAQNGGQSQPSQNGARSQGSQGGQNNQQTTAPQTSPGTGGGGYDDDDEFDGRRSRRGRYRDRKRGRERPVGQGSSLGQGQGQGQESDPVIREDDVLAPVAGILDLSDSYAFLRTSGYLAGPKDVYVSMNLVRRNGLRRGDAITGVVRANATESDQQGSRREKYVPLVRLDTINGVPPEEARNRPEFAKLTPLYPQERLRLETEPTDLVTRVIDLVMPIGKGQRALIVSPPKAGKTTVLQRIANAISVNNPEVHLMIVLVDERPEEVTDMQRSVKGEVIASTFDRPASDHTTLSELAIERAKRLVELGHDVVVMLDNLTRLGRAYNLAAPASGRILSGGVDSAALYPPKRFLGAARNIENGGSLTILATALVDTGSTMDTVIFEEFKGTGNAELMLSRKIADKRTFPAVDIDPSGTRKDDLLMSPEEHAIVQKLRRVLHSLDSQAAIELLLSKLKETHTNIEFLMQIAKTTPGE